MFYIYNIFFYAILFWIVSHILLKNNLTPISKITWVALFFFLPYPAIIIYWLFGNERLSKKAREYKASFEHLKEIYPDYFLKSKKDFKYSNSFNYASSINNFKPLGGNKVELINPQSKAQEDILDSINQASSNISITYYIWLPDKTGISLCNSLIEASKRGVRCRVLVDHIGSKKLIKSPYWKEMIDAGIEAKIDLYIKYLPLGYLFIFFYRIDIRNHRKLALIDDRTAYIGSQNCADDNYQNSRYGPWEDIVVKINGPLVHQLKILFLSDWAPAVGEFFTFNESNDIFSENALAVSIADGPTERYGAFSQFLVCLLNEAKSCITITTPYFVPDSNTLDSLCSAALRGIKVTLILPHLNNSKIVSYASKITYFNLLKSGVKIYEYLPGLLHSKTLLIDNKKVCLGSSNLDLRSFNLNYENNILVEDIDFAFQIKSRQNEYIRKSIPVLLSDVEKMSRIIKFRNNIASVLRSLI
ncbi:MAG: cardiolipin synthase [Psittacicella sp.]